jgi:putative transcriptional regulator
MNNQETSMTTNSEEYLRKVGSMIRTVRESKKLSREQVGELISIDRAEFSRIEAGKRNITIATLVRIAGALECSLDIILMPCIPNN